MEIQFNWIFVLIVGTVILMFFVSVAGEYKKNAELEIAEDIIHRLSTISTAGQLSQDSNQLIEVSGLELTTGCNPVLCTEMSCPTEFDFSGMGISAPEWVGIEPIFSPKKMYGDALVMWALQLNMPFYVGNALYLTTPGYRYILIYNDDIAGNDDFADELLYELRKNKYLDVEQTSIEDIGSVRAKPGSFTKFIFLYLPPVEETYGVHESISKSESWDVMFIEPSEDYPLESGSIYYSKIDDNGVRRPDDSREASYYTLPLLIGAIYSDDFASYSCNFHKAILKYRDVNKVYEERTNLLLGSGGVCSSYYTAAKTPPSYEQVESSITDYLEDGDMQTAIGVFDSVSQHLKDINYQASLKDCPLIY